MLASFNYISNSMVQHTNANIRFLARVIDRDLGNSGDPFLDGIGDVRDHLNGLSEVIATAFALNHGLVDLSSCDVVIAGQLDSKVSIVKELANC